MRPALLATIGLLAGCGYPSYYPDGSRYADVYDTDASDDCATATLEAVRLSVETSRDDVADLYVVGDDCSSAWVGSVSAGAPAALDTTAGTWFRAEVGGSVVATLQVPSGAATYTWQVP